MAAPESKTLRDLNGVWFMNKTISDDTDPALALQGISWLTRTAISLASVTLHLKQYTDEQRTAHVDIDTKLTGGISGTTENRVMDWQWSAHQDHIFGLLQSRSRFTTLGELKARTAGGADARGDAGSDSVADEEDRAFLTDGWESGLVDGTANGEGGQRAEVVETYAESEGGGWTARQVWGFEDVQVGEKVERRYVRHVVIRKGKGVKRLRLVYDWVPQ